MWRLTPDFAIVDGYKDSFAPDFEIPGDFEDVIVDDFHEMTYTSYDEAHSALENFRDAEPLDDRMREALVPVMAIFGEEDQRIDVDEAVAGLEDVPGIRITTLPGVGHTPQIEAPEKTAGLIEDFAKDAAPEVVGTATEKPAKDQPKYVKRKRDKPKPEKKANGGKGDRKKGGGGGGKKTSGDKKTPGLRVSPTP